MQDAGDLWSVYSSANLFYSFFQQKRKKEYYLSLSYLHILKYGKK